MDKEILLELLGVGKEHTAEEYRQNFLKDDFRLVGGTMIKIMKTAQSLSKTRSKWAECEKFTVRHRTV